MNTNKRIARIAALILFIVLVALVIGVASTHPLPASPPQGRAQSTQAEAPTQVAAQPTTAPTAHATSTPVIVPTIAPTATAQPIATAVPTRAPVPTPKPTVDIATLPAYQLAAIDGADFSDPVVIAQYQSVLDRLHDKTGDSEVSIANTTYAGQTILTKDGYTLDDRMITLMDAVDSAITKPEHMKYNESLSALIILMENGG